jgi:hypothetical protein
MSALISTRTDSTSRFSIAATIARPEVDEILTAPSRPLAERAGEPLEKAAIEAEPPETWQTLRCEAPDAGREERACDDGGFRHGRSKG